MLNRRLILRLCVVAGALALPIGLRAQPHPYEPLNPAKAQSLEVSPLQIDASGKVHTFQVEVARTEKEHEIGLMHRNHMDADHGMLFVFKPPRPIKFWMRNTFIPLDMIFTDAKGRVIYIAENVQPHVETPVGPDRLVCEVLEVNAGVAKSIGLQIGDRLRHASFDLAQ